MMKEVNEIIVDRYDNNDNDIISMDMCILCMHLQYIYDLSNYYLYINIRIHST